MDDLISRQAAIDATWFEPSYTDPLNVEEKGIPIGTYDLKEAKDE